MDATPTNDGLDEAIEAAIDALDPSGLLRDGMNLDRLLEDDELRAMVLGPAHEKIRAFTAQQAGMARTVARSARMLVTRGWSIGDQPVAILEQACDLVAAHKPEEADALMAAVWDADWRVARTVARVRMLRRDDTTARITDQRARLLTRAQEHHLAERYDASVMILLAQIEGIVIDRASGAKFFTKNKPADMGSPTPLVNFLGGMSILQELMRASSDETVADGALLRHAIMHGRELAYDTKVNSAKCWALLDTIAVWAGAVSNTRSNGARSRDDVEP